MAKHLQSSSPSRLVLVAALALASAQAHAAPVYWDTPTTINAASDVLTTGALKYAYTESNAAASVNGVNFSAGSSFTSLGGGNVTLSGTGFTRVDNVFGSPTGMTGDYTKLLTGAASGASTAGTVTLNNITADHEYATQIWVNDSRNGTSGRSGTVSSTGGNSVTLNYTNTGATGGKGQFSTGKFVADATSQAITLDGTGSTPTQLNAIQVRDVSASWSGTTSGTWADSDTTSSNFSGLNFTAAKAQSTVAVFGDTTTAGGSVSNFNLTVGAGGASTGTVLFENTTAQSYSIASADSTGITGTTSIKKTGNGTVTLTGINTYTGATTVANGTLVLQSAFLADTSTLAIHAGATLHLDYLGTDIVGSLVLGTTTYTTGTFDSGNSGGRITGSGKIQVGASGYDTWAVNKGVNGGTGGDDDADGIKNLVEYALGLEPKSADASPGTLVGLVLSFTKGAEAVAAGDVTYGIETSTDMSGWSPVLPGDSNLSNLPGSISYTLPADPGGKFFARLVITKP